MRNTKQKSLIMQCLKENELSHITIDELYAKVKEIDSHIGIATIYRNLKLLEEQGLVNKVVFSVDSAPCYELIDGKLSHTHHHLICKKCQKVMDFEDDLLDAIEKIIEVTKGFKISDHRVIFYGTCKDCLQEQAQLKMED